MTKQNGVFHEPICCLLGENGAICNELGFQSDEAILTNSVRTQLYSTKKALHWMTTSEMSPKKKNATIISSLDLA